MALSVRPSRGLCALGPLALYDDGVLIPLGGRVPRRLLASLMVQRGSVASTDWLIEVVWGEAMPEEALAGLRTYVSRLRRVLPGWVRVESLAPGYRLDVREDDVDIDRFESQVRHAFATAGGSPERAVDRLGEALEMWQGDAFAEFRDEWWAQAAAARLEELRLAAMEERADLLISMGRLELAVSDAMALTVAQPLRERPWRALVVALHRTGRQGDALRAAHAYRRRLRDEVGLDPSSDFVVLERDVASALVRPPPGEPLPEEPAASRAPVRVAPRAAAELIGREADVHQVTARLAQHPLVTLVGPGGIGKTRLALAAAMNWGTERACRVEVIELARVRDEANVVAAVATQLDVQPQQGRTTLESVLDVVGSAHCLVVLDNCEHVLDAISEVAAELLRCCPQVRLLATSRAPLDIPGEAVSMTAPLAVDISDGDRGFGEPPAVALFEQRARTANSSFRLDAVTRPVVVELCRRLDGLPLAIELAAARTRALSPADILARLADRFDLLGSRRATEARQRSLRDLVEWSYQLLGDEERQLFRRLSVFAGVFDLRAVEEVCCDASLPERRAAVLLASLVDKSMVQFVSGPEGRYRLLETLRDYAATLLTDGDEGLAARHRRWVLGACAAAAAGVYGPSERTWLELLDGMFDDLRVVVARGIETRDLDVALAVVVDAREYAFRRLRYELIGWAEAAITVEGVDRHRLGPAAYGIAAYGRFVKGEAHAAIELGEHAQQLAARLGADTFGIAERALGNAWSFLGTLTPTLDQLVELAVESGEPARIAHAYYSRSMSEVSGGDAQTATTFAERAHDAAVMSGSPTALAQAAFAMGTVSTQSDPERAAELLRRSEAFAREAGNLWVELAARTETLSMLALDGQPLAALAEFADVIAAWQRAGEWANQWLSLRNVFAICHQLGAYDLASVIHEALERADALHAYPYEPLTAARIATALSDSRYHRQGDVVPPQTASGEALPAVIARIIDDLRAYTAAE